MGKAARKHWAGERAPRPECEAPWTIARPRGEQGRRVEASARGEADGAQTLASLRLAVCSPRNRAKRRMEHAATAVTAAVPNGECGTRLSISNSVGLGTNRPWAPQRTSIAPKS